MTEGLFQTKSHYPPSETIDRLTDAVIERGMKVFSRIDFAADAAEAGLRLATTILLVFGNPKVGTALLQQNQQSGIDLPLKALAYSSGGEHWLAFNAPSFIAARHGVENTVVIERMTGALRSAVDQAVNPDSVQP
jgi:uncharacterized protein (DUF302 family)